MVNRSKELLDILVAKNALNDNASLAETVLIYLDSPLYKKCFIMFHAKPVSWPSERDVRVDGTQVLPYALTRQTHKLGLEGASQLRRCVFSLFSA